MNEYKCIYCNFKTTLKTNYMSHIVTLKHFKNTSEHKKLNVEFNDMPIVNIQDKLLKCKYCDKPFKHKQSMHYHIKFSCTKNKDEDLKELVRLMNLQKNENDQLKKKVSEMEEEMTKIKQAKNIKKLTQKLQINGNIHIQNNIQLLAYKDTDISHLTDKDYINCIKQVNYCVKKMIEKIHFNPEKPENMNIYISNIKDKYMMVYDGNTWNLSTKEYELGKIYEEKEYLLEEWIEDNQFPEIKDKFLRYLNNKEKDDNLNAIKDDIKLMMYNKKCLIEIKN